MQAQFDISINQKKTNAYQANQFSEQQDKKDHKLDRLMGNVYHHPGLLIQKHPPRFTLRGKKVMFWLTSIGHPVLT
jgi:hypothetical protein